MIKKLLPEFEEQDKQHVTEDYIKRSTRASGIKEVRKYLKDYITNSGCTKEVEKFIRLYLDNIALLKKTDIVCDGSYRNCVILIKPFEFYVTHCGGLSENGYGFAMKEALQYFLDYSTKIFLNISWTSKEDEYYYWGLIDEFDDDDY